jgi:HEAT repeat protein
LTLSKSTSPEMRSYAAEALGRRAATDPAAAAKVREILADPSALMPATAAAEGLGKTGGDASVAILADSLAAGAGSAKASAAALAAIGGPAASAALIKTLKEQKGEAALAAVSVMGQMQGCPDCVRTLEEQYKSHPDPEVRKLIGVLLEVPLQHKH